jgi:hypothetical protein
VLGTPVAPPKLCRTKGNNPCSSISSRVKLYLQPHPVHAAYVAPRRQETGNMGVTTELGWGRANCGRAGGVRTRPKQGSMHMGTHVGARARAQQPQGPVHFVVAVDVQAGARGLGQGLENVQDLGQGVRAGLLATPLALAVNDVTQLQPKVDPRRAPHRGGSTSRVQRRPVAAQLHWVGGGTRRWWGGPS